MTAREGEFTLYGKSHTDHQLVGTDNETLLDPSTGLLTATCSRCRRGVLQQVGELQRRATADQRRYAREACGSLQNSKSFDAPSRCSLRSRSSVLEPPAGRPLFHCGLSEFPEVFVDEHGEPRAGGGFDAVIGNPPYIRVPEIDRGMANYCRSRFLYASDFVRSLRRLPRAWSQSIVPDQERLGFIVPNKIFSS